MVRTKKIPNINISLSKTKNFIRNMKLYKKIYNKIYYQTYVKPFRKAKEKDTWLGKYRCPCCGTMSFLKKFQEQHIPEIILYSFQGRGKIKTYRPATVPQDQEKLYLLYLIAKAQTIFNYCKVRLKDLGYVFAIERELELSPIIQERRVPTFQERSVRAPIFVERNISTLREIENKISLTKETDIPVIMETN